MMYHLADAGHPGLSDGACRRVGRGPGTAVIAPGYQFAALGRRRGASDLGATAGEEPRAMAAMQTPTEDGYIPQPQAGQGERRCPWCGSDDVRLTSRGYTGPTDEVDQYFTCGNCRKTTYELVAKTAREMRLGRFRAGGLYKDPTSQDRYQISRVLKVGVNEFLIYLKPLVEGEDEAAFAGRASGA